MSVSDPQMSSCEHSGELCRSGEYSVVEMFDMALLVWDGGEMIVGDHCLTDPQCAVIDVANGWCVSGGEGLEIVLFENGFPQGSHAPVAAGIKRLGLWRHGNPPPDGERYWFVAKAWHYRDDLIRALVNTQRGEVGTYEVDVRTLQWTKL